MSSWRSASGCATRGRQLKAGTGTDTTCKKQWPVCIRGPAASRPSCRHLGRRHYRKRGPAPSIRHMTSVFREHKQRHASEHPPVHLRSPPSSTPPYISCRRVVARACFYATCAVSSSRAKRAGGSSEPKVARGWTEVEWSHGDGLPGQDRLRADATGLLAHVVARRGQQHVRDRI